MSPTYNYSPSKATATMEVWDNGTYEVIVGQPKAFQKKEGDTVKNFGVGYSIQSAEDPKKRGYVRFYLHNDASEGMTKKFQMAALGYGTGKVEEQRFNDDMENEDWALDFDSGDCGEAWKNIAGSRLIVDAEIQQNPNTGDPQNNFKNWRRLGS